MNGSDSPHYPGSLVATIRTGRRALAWWLAACIVLALGRCATWQGWLRPVRVASGSMADGLWGPHWSVVCVDCGVRFRCGTDHPPDHGRPVCPNCGCLNPAVDSQTVQPGRRVWIDRLAFWSRRPRRGEPVAYWQDGPQAGRFVKRIVAGPGQHVSIADGELWVDGQMLAKSLDQLRQVGIEVHDDRFRPQFGPPDAPRWRPASAGSGWTAEPDGYRFRPAQAAPVELLDWLDYQQWTCRPNPTPPVERTHASPVLDDYGYNQGLSRGSLHPVHDLLLSSRVELADDARFVVRLVDRGQEFRVLLIASRHEVRVERNGQVVARRPYRLAARPLLLEVATCDRRLLVGINCLPMLELSYRPWPDGELVERAWHGPSVAASGGDVLFSAPRLARDVYYLGPGGIMDWQRAQPVPPDCWFVLGDNVPISADSRWGTCVRSVDLLGPVLTLSRADCHTWR